jgi:hypothetical protein
MTHFVPDYEHLYLQEEYSDVTLVISDENEAAAAAGQKRKRKSTARTVPGHCVLLLGHSGYCKAKVNQHHDPLSVHTYRDTRIFWYASPVPESVDDLQSS